MYSNAVVTSVGSLLTSSNEDPASNGYEIRSFEIGAMMN
jgi:hypothetical protein